MENGIDIVIPVYNALEELKDCLNSILKFTDLINNWVIVINDCSPDPNVKVFLDSLKESHVIVLENEKNLGFVSTVNKGMQFSNRDVILLNSDTIVTEKWLDKLKIAAYSNEAIGTVTPFTNNGSICSIPNFCEDNEIPKGYNIDSFAALIEKISINKYPEIPTAVGFCMFIKRKVINIVGLFDDVTFNKGYGEENDFCCRAIENGYLNILADDTFVYHKGSMSFKEEKMELVKENSKKLNKKHPGYDLKVYEFIHVYNPLKKLHHNLNFFLEQNAFSDHIKQNVLYLCHNFFDQEYNHPIGGTEYHLSDLVKNLKQTNAFVLVSNYKELILKHYQNGELIQKYRYRLDVPFTQFHFHHRQYSEYVERIMLDFEIDILHIHHLKCHTFDAPFLAKKLNIPVLLTLHDYYLINPHYEFDFKNVFENEVISKIENSFSNAWKRNVADLIEKIDLFITPSEVTKNNFSYYYPSMNIEVIEHGIVLKEKKNILKQYSTPLKIGFIGGLSPIKGSELVHQIIKRYNKNDIEWHLIGGLGDQKLNLLQQKNLYKHGAYKREELAEILESTSLDIAVFLSQSPETFSFTLSEAWNFGLPVIVSPVGALKERVLKNGGGWILESNSVESFCKTMDSIMVDSAKQTAEKQEQVLSINISSVADMTECYSRTYDKLKNEKPKMFYKKFKQSEILSLQEAASYFKKEDSSVPIINSNQSYVEDLEQEIRMIKATIGWKILEVGRRKFKWVFKFGKKIIYYILKFKRSVSYLKK